MLPETKCVPYISLVRPLLEYGSAVWEPYLQKDIQNNIEMIQQRAACWVKSDYRYNSSVSTTYVNSSSFQHQQYVAS